MRAGQVVLTRECLDCTSGGSSDGGTTSGEPGTPPSGPFIQKPAIQIDEPVPDTPLPSAQPSVVATPGSPGTATNVGVVPIKPPPGTPAAAPMMPSWLPWALAALVVLAALGGHE